MDALLGVRLVGGGGAESGQSRGLHGYVEMLARSKCAMLSLYAIFYSFGRDPLLICLSPSPSSPLDFRPPLLPLHISGVRFSFSRRPALSHPLAQDKRRRLAQISKFTYITTFGLHIIFYSSPRAPPSSLATPNPGVIFTFGR